MLSISDAPRGMDILNTLGNAADNILTGRNKGLTVSEFESLWRDGGDDVYFLDCREWGDAGKIVEGHPDRWHNIPQGELRERLAEVPRDKKIVLMGLCVFAVRYSCSMH